MPTTTRAKTGAAQGTAKDAAATALSAHVAEETALRTAGQRKINRLWEYTQSFIAVSVTTNALSVCAWLVYTNNGIDHAVSLLSNALFLVIGFYFGRTNHTRVSGPPGSSISEER